jgi:nucleoside 2-deoxyribosyltransferase
MDNKKRKYFIQIISSIISVFAVIVSIFAINGKQLENMHSYITTIIICISASIIVEVLFYFIQRTMNSSKKETYKLDKLIRYSKKRKELEEEISLLTRELMHSDLSEYLNVNRLVFEGQNIIGNNKSINYKVFLKQFGLLNDNIEIRKNSAVFLTPFTEEGEHLFRDCQKILSNVDIFLQRTDNYVEKEDIMMNIVSLIVQSEIVIVNINGRNPNVYYELGIAHAIGKPTILLSETKFESDDIAFDLRQKRIIMYSSMQDLEQQLLYQISRLKNKVD